MRLQRLLFALHSTINSQVNTFKEIAAADFELLQSFLLPFHLNTQHSRQLLETINCRGFSSTSLALALANGPLSQADQSDGRCCKTRSTGTLCSLKRNMITSFFLSSICDTHPRLCLATLIKSALICSLCLSIYRRAGHGCLHLIRGTNALENGFNHIQLHKDTQHSFLSLEQPQSYSRCRNMLIH